MTAAGFVLAVILFAVAPMAELDRQVDLRGMWRMQIGDSAAYAEPDFDDSDWKPVRVPGEWENQGFPGYDGFAWYRRTFRTPRRLSSTCLVLLLGRIDDVDSVFVNGRCIGGSGSPPPEYRTAYDYRRAYPLPATILRPRRENTIAVKIYDKWYRGGIYEGKVGIFTRSDWINLVVDLSGAWRFKPGDNPRWSSPRMADSTWTEITVPSHWESQGFAEHDRYAWYRRAVRIDTRLAEHELVLLLGQIDDIDQVFVNGVAVDGTGTWPVSSDAPQHDKDYPRESYHLQRAYPLPHEAVRYGKINHIAVRVYDYFGNGGIWRGPVGIATGEEYAHYRRCRGDD